MINLNWSFNEKKEKKNKKKKIKTKYKKKSSKKYFRRKRKILIKKNKKKKVLSRIKKKKFDDIILNIVRFQENIKNKFKIKLNFDIFSIDRYIQKFFQKIDNKFERYKIIFKKRTSYIKKRTI